MKKHNARLRRIRIVATDQLHTATGGNGSTEPNAHGSTQPTGLSLTAPVGVVPAKPGK